MQTKFDKKYKNFFIKSNDIYIIDWTHKFEIQNFIKHTSNLIFRTPKINILIFIIIIIIVCSLHNVN